MAIMMVTSNLTAEQVLDPDTEIAFPESVVSFFRGDLGQPYGGFPAGLQKKVLKGAKPMTTRPGEVLPPIDLQKARAEAQSKTWREITDEEFASYLMYPKVFLDYMRNRLDYGRVSVLPTPLFFYGMEPGEEVTVDIERGKTLIVRFVAVSDSHEDGTRTVFFELNGQPREVFVPDRSLGATLHKHPKADPDDPNHIAAPMPGKVSTVAVKKGDAVKAGDRLLSIEAMKMETAVYSPRDAKVVDILVKPGSAISAQDLLVVLE
jgi:pyruvate carboxylase